MGRLGAKVGAGAWCAKSNDNAQYLQIDLGHVNQIRSLGIQGKEGVSRHPTVESAWVKNFTVSYSVDGLTWTDHEEDGVSKVCLICLFATKLQLLYVCNESFNEHINLSMNGQLLCLCNSA